MMKRWISSIALIAFTQGAFAHVDTFDVPAKMKSFEASDALYIHPDTTPINYLAVKPMEVKGFTGSNLTKVQNAFKLLEKVVNSEEFKERVINFKNDNGEQAFASNNGMTNEEIYEHFMEGRETLQHDTPYEMNFFVKLYKSPWYNPWSKVIGYTTPDTNVINMNQKYFTTFKISDVAGNLAHEWTHKIGFDHKSASEHDSAPYAIGYIVRELAEKMSK